MNTISRLIRIIKIIAPEYLVGMVGVVVISIILIVNRGVKPPENIPVETKVTAPNPYSSVSIGAKSAYVYDALENKELFNLNGDSQLPLASLTKVMMAVTALSLAPENTVITMSPKFLETEGDSGLFSNEKWSLKDLLGLTLIESSNDGANAIASVAGAVKRGGIPDDWGKEEFIKAMNKKASELGLTQTYFLNPTGLDESASVSGAYGSARDSSKLFAYAIEKYPMIFGVTRHSKKEFDSLSDLKHKVKNTNTFVNKIPSLLGSKTGYTDLAGGNLTIAFDAGINHPVVVTVLGSTEEGRFEDTEKLVWATLKYLEVN